jgi:carbon-monoxide dehydrogenase small subunit
MTCTVPVERTLADLLRDDLGLKGTKIGCSRGVCGACVALVNGEPVAGCSTFAFQAHGCNVVSIEGLAKDGAMHAIQQAFIARSAFQCGYCTAGMILVTKALLDRHPNPDRATIVEWLSSIVCRCTGYALIIEAVEDAAHRLNAEARG